MPPFPTTATINKIIQLFEVTTGYVRDFLHYSPICLGIRILLNPKVVIPAKAGIYFLKGVDSCLRRNDKSKFRGLFDPHSLTDTLKNRSTRNDSFEFIQCRKYDSIPSHRFLSLLLFSCQGEEEQKTCAVSVVNVAPVLAPIFDRFKEGARMSPAKSG